MDNNNPALEAQHLLLLGKIDGRVEGILEHQQAQLVLLQGLDSRLRQQEVKVAKIGAFSGALSGSVVSIGIALVVEGLKNWSARGTPTP